MINLELIKIKNRLREITVEDVTWSEDGEPYKTHVIDLKVNGLLFTIVTEQKMSLLRAGIVVLYPCDGELPIYAIVKKGEIDKTNVEQPIKYGARNPQLVRWFRDLAAASNAGTYEVGRVICKGPRVLKLE